MDKVFCLHCRDFMEYNVDLEPPINELVARCVACHHEVYVPHVNDYNVMERMKDGEGK